MIYLILSDIHGNLEALQAVLLEVNSIKIDKYVVLGDLVGYGANPNEVVERVKEKNPLVAIRGNHDKAGSGLSDTSNFNHAAAHAALWTRRQLSRENRDFVVKLPQGPVEVDGLFDIVHGAPWDEDYYIFQWRQALSAFQRSGKSITFFGHTHIPVVWAFDGDELKGEAVSDDRYELSLKENTRYLINPGSVGQPRDGNPKASLAVFDAGKTKIEFFRMEYNVKAAQEKILKAELDDYLARRLAFGK